jgi:beta-lactamase regulating signal transducer with metallopeptidase domain
MTAFLKDSLLFVSCSPELLLLAKATLFLLLALAAASFAARHRASTRHLIWTAVFAALLALPLIARFAPSATLEVPIPVVANTFLTIVPLDSSGQPLGDRPALPAFTPPPAEPTSTLPSWPTILRAIWIAGIAIFLVPLLLDLWRLQRLRRNALPWRAAQHRVPQGIQLLLHENLDTPLTCGIFHPAVILPATARDWPEAELRCALTHELEHVRRRDWPIHLATRAIAALYWFHPLAWTAWRRLGLEAERACDDAVIQNEESTTYADQLVSLAERMNTTNTQPALAMAHRGDLATRVSALLDRTQQRGRATRLAAVTAAAAAVIAIVGLAPLTAVAQPQLPSPNPQPNAQPRPQAVPRPAKAQGTRPSALDRALYEASEEGSLTDIGALINAGANVNALVHGDGTPLLGASRKGHLDAVRFLLDRGADPNLGIGGDGNPLLTAAGDGHLEVVKLLLDRGANPDAAVPGDGNALITAAQNGHLAILGMLLDRGASIDLVVPGDENALMQASENGHLTAVRYLVSRGANVNAKVWVEERDDRPGEWRTALNRAQKNGHTAVVEYLKSTGARE